METLGKIEGRTALIGVIGLGYVGLPLALEFCRASFNVMGFDLDEEKVVMLKAGRSYIKHIASEKVVAAHGRFTPTSDFGRLGEPDCLVICLPTPLKDGNNPDLSYVLDSGRMIARHLRKGQLVVLESTTYPGTTDEELRGVLEASGLRAGVDFHLAYSPEREDPNNADYSTGTIPKLVGGYTRQCLRVARALYDSVVVSTIPVSSTRVAEATKLLENIFRSVNIALVNELKMLFDRMDIDVWEVIEAARTKPFGFMPFYPGPGLGGHCIPIDPFYLTWKARQYDFETRFIELAGEVNTYMPDYVLARAVQYLKDDGIAIKGARVLVLGIAYKKDVDDQRESPSLRIIQMLAERGADVSYSDPHVPVSRGHRHYPGFEMKSLELDAEALASMDLALLLTDHTAFDYHLMEKHSKRIIDTRNAFRRHGIESVKVRRA